MKNLEAPAYYRIIDENRNAVLHAVIRPIAAGSDWVHCLKLAPGGDITTTTMNINWLPEDARIPLANVTDQFFVAQVNTAFYGSAQAA